jgi:hypothetical protein
MSTEVEKHYSESESLVSAIAASLRAVGIDPERVSTADLAAVDEFHIGGRKATLLLADAMGIGPESSVLDIGSGLGGSWAPTSPRWRRIKSPTSDKGASERSATSVAADDVRLSSTTTAERRTNSHRVLICAARQHAIVLLWAEGPTKEVTMEILIVNFTLDGLSVEEFARSCDELAPAFAAVPGLVSKVWLADRAEGIFGGVYTFESEAAVDDYLHSDLWAGVGATPGLANISVRRFGVLEAPTRVTRGLAQFVDTV